MTKIFRSSLYRSKQPEEEKEEEESAAGEYEYVDLEDGNGGKHAGGGGGGGLDSDGPLAACAVLTTILGIYGILAGCLSFVYPRGLEPGSDGPQATVAIVAGALFLAFAAAAFVLLAVLWGHARLRLALEDAAGF